MQVITVNGAQYIAEAIDTAKGVTTIEGAMAFSGSELTNGVISSYIQKRNVAGLSNMGLNGMQSFQTRELSAAEGIALAHAEAQFKLALEVAIPRLQNDTFAQIQAGL